MSTAKQWMWPEKKQSMIQKSLTLAHNCGDSLVRVLRIPAPWIPAGENLVNSLERAVKALPARSVSDLAIAPASQHDLRPLQGRPLLEHREERAPVFLDGLEASFTVGHNGRGDDTVLLERLQLRSQYTPGEDPYYDYERDPQIVGLGPVVPLRFQVSVGVNGVSRARRVLDRKSGEVETAYSENFFDSKSETYYSFAPGEAQKVIKVAISASDVGKYELTFLFFYRVGTGEVRCQESIPIHVYRKS